MSSMYRTNKYIAAMCRDDSSIPALAKMFASRYSGVIC